MILALKFFYTSNYSLVIVCSNGFSTSLLTVLLGKWRFRETRRSVEGVTGRSVVLVGLVMLGLSLGIEIVGSLAAFNLSILTEVRPCGRFNIKNLGL